MRTLGRRGDAILEIMDGNMEMRETAVAFEREGFLLWLHTFLLFPRKTTRFV